MQPSIDSLRARLAEADESCDTRSQANASFEQKTSHTHPNQLFDQGSRIIQSRRYPPTSTRSNSSSLWGGQDRLPGRRYELDIAEAAGARRKQPSKLVENYRRFHIHGSKIFEHLARSEKTKRLGRKVKSKQINYLPRNQLIRRVLYVHLDATVDIYLVHALGGHPRYTWTAPA